MTYTQFRRALLQLGIDSQSAAARVLGVSRKTIIRYWHSRNGIPESVVRLIDMYKRHGIPQEYQP